MPFLAFIKNLYWRLKYRRGQKVFFTYACDGICEILVVENNIATTGTIRYRARQVDVWNKEQGDFGDVLESTVPEMLHSLTPRASGIANVSESQWVAPPSPKPLNQQSHPHHEQPHAAEMPEATIRFASPFGFGVR